MLLLLLLWNSWSNFFSSGNLIKIFYLLTLFFCHRSLFASTSSLSPSLLHHYVTLGRPSATCPYKPELSSSNTDSHKHWVVVSLRWSCILLMLFLEVHPVVHLLFFFCLHSQTSTTCWADYVVVRSRHIWFYECSTFGSSEANKCCREIKLCFWTTGNDWRQVNWPWQLRFLFKKTEENKLSVLHLTVVQIFKSCGCFLAHFYLVVKSFLCSFFLQLFSSAAWRWLLLFFLCHVRLCWIFCN